MISIPLWLTQPQPCSYLADRDSQSVVVDPSTELSTDIYSELIQLGYRRSGNQVYKAHCGDCAACVATRVAVSDFTPSRAQRRCTQRNSSTQVIVHPAHFNQQHFDLYCRYQASRHDRTITHHSPQDYWQFLGSDWCQTWFVEFHHDNQLIALAVVDQLNNALSAVYTFFDPEQSALSPGVFAVLWQIDYARQLGLDYVYLGFWIADCRKMRYKIQYQPLQGLIADQWQIVPTPNV